MSISSSEAGSNNTEVVQPQKTGILHAFNPGTREWCVLVDGGERLIFTADACLPVGNDSKDVVFNNLVKGDEISFNRGEGAEWDKIRNVAFVSSMDTDVLTTRVQNNFTTAIDAVETMEPKISGTIRTMRIFSNPTPDKDAITKGLIIPTDPANGGKPIEFFHVTCIGGFSTFEALHKRDEGGEKIKVTYNIIDK